MTGGRRTAAPGVYDLTAPTQFRAIDNAPGGHLTVSEPTALIVFEIPQIPRPAESQVKTRPSQTRNGATTYPSCSRPRSSRRLRMPAFRRRLASPAEGFAADKQLAIDIRKFQISTSPEPMAEIEFAARILSDNGRVVEAKVFRASVPVHG